MRSGKLDYAAFCELVMGSSSEDITSFAASPTRRMDQPAVLPGDARSFEVSVRRRVIDNWKDLKNLFTHLENLPVRSPQPTLASSWLVPDPEFVGSLPFAGSFWNRLRRCALRLALSDATALCVPLTRVC